MKVGILGGGLSGLTIARMLQEHGVESVVFEKEQRIGGLCRTNVIDGYVFDVGGGHVFNSKNERIKRWVFSILPEQKWQFSIRKSKIEYKGNLVDYPFELSLAQLPINEAVDCILDYIKAKGNEANNFYDWLKWKFGDSIANKYLIPYNAKIWNYDLRNMEVGWVSGKIPLVSAKEVLKAALTKDPTEREMPHSSYYYPREGGIYRLIQSIAETLGNIRTDYPIESLERIANKWVVNGEAGFDEIISTIPLKELGKTCVFLPSSVKKAIEDLKYNSLTTSLFETSPSDLSWVYCPDKTKRSHRLVYIGNFTKNNAPAGKSSLIAEATGDIDPLIQAGEFGFEEVIATNYTKYAYIIFDKNYSRNIKIINDYLDQQEIFRVGRFAEWKYYNMDICIQAALRCVEGIVGTSGSKVRYE